MPGPVGTAWASVVFGFVERLCNLINKRRNVLHVYAKGPVLFPCKYLVLINTIYVF